MKTTYITAGLLTLICCISGRAADPAAQPQPHPESPIQKVLDLTEIPGGIYSTNLELKQLDGIPATLRLDVRDGRITGNHDRFGELKGRISPIGNGVFMVQLRGKDYRASQFWVFRPDGTAIIREIPDRGEKQLAVPEKK
ncbi:MAG: hypothetical protein JWL81_2625 [Verrucomicrobiales bacterium]|nr:hypothetical protein [Verrucomicrobiales bacterium]